MKILVIGNGFDLAHGLPTKYNDFLEFLLLIKTMSKYHGTTVDFISKQLNESSVDNNIKQYIQNLILRITEEYGRNNEKAGLRFQNINTLVSKSEDKVLQELIAHLEENLWYEYFIKTKSYINEGWIDFESEISRVVKTLDQYKTKGLFDQQDIVEKDIKQILLSVTVLDGSSSKFKVDEKEVQKLEGDLNKLIRSLEIFLEDCIGKINIGHILPDIQSNKFDKILSFNYTNTYEKVYAPQHNILYDFIHGKADITRNIDTNNMVLGIDEYLDSTQASKNTSFIFYKKYFQRIHKETGCDYRDWIQNITSSKYQSELFIFGHSLDITDKDILRELIETKGLITTIFYYNKKVYASQIANLVKVLGVDNLVSRVHGQHRSIIFKQQQNPIRGTEL
ncbi:bacteriophage abortive infection AbiH family protein [Paenibacillus peoriae]|uniref:bacteriophage abortive infection AbiH family protein n=1 Tax=Paenibacillus peoriae TaxID=59893 RepID=UPI00026C5A19|nr:bacteriophage abortive infection AbiH family protein [Paenibacillus peoriae]MEC0181340.1 bacteriophage abortive infection AbiH family protein [Paenibacillus peoriae]